MALKNYTSALGKMYKHAVSKPSAAETVDTHVAGVALIGTQLLSIYAGAMVGNYMEKARLAKGRTSSVIPFLSQPAEITASEKGIAVKPAKETRVIVDHKDYHFIGALADAGQARIGS